MRLNMGGGAGNNYSRFLSENWDCEVIHVHGAFTLVFLQMPKNMKNFLTVFLVIFSYFF